MLSEALAVAIETLSWVELENLSPKAALHRTVKQLGVTDVEATRAANRMVFETLKRLNLIDHFLKTVVDEERLNQTPLGVKAFLRVYIYETRLSPRRITVPLTYVKAAREILGWKAMMPVEEDLGRILNLNASKPIQNLPEFKKLSLTTYNTEWFVKYCFRLLGRVQALGFLKSSMMTLPTYLRLNTLRDEEGFLLEQVGREGLKLRKVPELAHVYAVTETKVPIVRTEAYRRGLLSLEDFSSCYAVEVAGFREGLKVLDVCAAPGVKTSHMAQLMANKGLICSVDSSRRRGRLWKIEIERMGVSNGELIIADAQRLLPIGLDADVVFIDPPCTGTGTFARNPHLKWSLSYDGVQRFTRVQWKIIETCANYVKEGGFLIYSTSSITVEENEMLVEKFLKHHPTFEPVKLDSRIGLPALRGLSMCKRLYPHINNSNGLFIAKLVKRL